MKHRLQVVLAAATEIQNQEIATQCIVSKSILLDDGVIAGRNATEPGNKPTKLYDLR